MNYESVSLSVSEKTQKSPSRSWKREGLFCLRFGLDKSVMCYFMPSFDFSSAEMSVERVFKIVVSYRIVC